MSRKKRTILEPLACIAQDASGHTIQVEWIETEQHAWKYAEQLLVQQETIKRVVFFDRTFVFVNALSLPGYLKYEDDVIDEHDRHRLLSKRKDEFMPKSVTQ